MTSDRPVTSGSLPDLLAARAAESASGVVTCERGKHRRILCLERGRLVYAISNVLEEQFVERLVREGTLAASDRDALVREARRGGGKPGALLADSGAVGPERLRDAMADHVRELALDCLTWTDGRFRFDPGKPSLDGETTTEIPIAEIVLRHVASHPAGIDAVRVRIGPPDLRVRLDPEAAAELATAAGDGALAHVLAGAAAPVTVADLVADAPGGQDAALRVVYGLLLLRVLRRGDTVSDAAAETAKQARGSVTREEIEGWLARARDATHYEILGVPQDASIDDIRSGYYRHARRLHPDRLRSGPFRDLLPQIETFFSRVTEAHNTLGDPDRRREYDRFLADARARPRDTPEADAAFLARQNFLRGKAAAEKRRFSEAVSFLENAVRMDEGQAEYRIELGRLLAQNPRFRADAEEHLRKAAEIDPSEPAVYLALAELYERLERRQDAVRALREALRWDPDNTEAKRRLRDTGTDPEGGDGGGLFGGLFGR